eukprot:TRINITY_DN6646_c0_g1_i1.p1 TRINITY_DN6646_c0_g1~~TRINITY_DN6646_c0_g1_i1.p1  ORF type:complete len:1877 (-),score=388.06 TRINITY_DN6646_c0_g1_i1:133-5763(-)
MCTSSYWNLSRAATILLSRIAVTFTRLITRATLSVRARSPTLTRPRPTHASGGCVPHAESAAGFLRVLARRFPKFFNVNEVNETAVGLLPPLGPDVLITEKIDGSLTSPLPLRGTIAWATRTSVCSAVRHYIDRCAAGVSYDAFALEWMAKGYTPLFEWCETGGPVGVIEHAAQALELLALRHNERGDFIPYPELLASAAQYRLPVTPQVSLSALTQYVEKPLPVTEAISVVSAWEGKEGVVLRYPDGHMYKVKSMWYVAQAEASKRAGAGVPPLLSLLRMCPAIALPAGAVWSTLLCGGCADDVLAACLSTLEMAGEAERARSLCAFARAVRARTAALLADILRWGEAFSKAADALPVGNRSRVHALSHFASLGWPPALLQSGARRDSARARSDLQDFLRVLCRDRAWLLLSHLLGVSWPPTEEEEAMQLQQDEVSSAVGLACYRVHPDLAAFGEAPPAVVAHVLHRYLPRKIAKYLGEHVQRVGDGTVVRVSAPYSPCEGKIKGMWEQFEKCGIVDLRVDLQPAAPAFTNHFGDQSWAHWQVQFGPSKVCVRSSRALPGRDAVGAYAGVLMRTDTDFTLAQFRHALELSFETHRAVFLADAEAQFPFLAATSPTPAVAAEDVAGEGEGLVKVYVDLDGVLADFGKAFAALTQRSPHEFIADELWRRVRRCPAFFSRLEWTSDGQSLWDFLCARRNEGCCTVAVLTAGPAGKFGKIVKKEKEQWCRQHLGAGVECIVCGPGGKPPYSFPGRVLVDDNPELQQRWDARGGLFVRHRSAAETQSALAALLCSRGGAVREAVRAMRERASAAPVAAYSQRRSWHFVDAVTEPSVVDLLVSTADAANIVGVDAEWRPEDLAGPIGGGGHSGRQQHRAAVLQLAFVNDVFVVDLLQPPLCLAAALERLLSRESCVKVGFGLEHDLPRLGVNYAVYPVADLQSVAARLLAPEQARQHLPSLNAVARLVLCADLHKCKELQASDWECRPLSQDQLQYAAADVAVLLDIYDALEASPALFAASRVLQRQIAAPAQSSLQQFSSPCVSAEDCPSGPVRVEFTALYLDAASREALLSALPPPHKCVAASHVTLAWHPQRNLVRGLPCGRTFCATVVGVAQDENVQAAVVELGGPWHEGSEQQYHGDDENHERQVREEGEQDEEDKPKERQQEHDVDDIGMYCTVAIPHVTVSCASGVAPAYSNELLARYGAVTLLAPGDPRRVALRGVVGVSVASDLADGDVQLPRRVLRALEDFITYAQPGEHLRFKPGELTAAERHSVHTFAERRGLQAQSEGREPQRQMTVTAPRHRCADSGPSAEEEYRVLADARILDEEELDEDRGKKKKKYAATKDRALLQRVTDPGVFAHLEIAERSEDLAAPEVENPVDGVVTDAGVEWLRVPQDAHAALVCSLLAPRYDEAGEIATPPPSEPLRVVVILRGLPGSGKTALRRLLEAAPHCHVAACSADIFFERGAGLSGRQLRRDERTPDERYRAFFDASLLPTAHEHCHAEFLAALDGADTASGKHFVVVVDNTNVRLSDYEWYATEAERHGFGRVVLELACICGAQASQDDLRLFRRRGVHAVPWPELAAMWRRFEPDSTALRLRPWRDDAPPSTAVGEGCGASSLARWLSDHHCFHTSRSRPVTHLQQAVGASPTRLIYVPPRLYGKFLQQYVAEAEPKYLIEVATAPLFHLYFDIDYIATRPPPCEDLLQIAQCLQAVLREHYTPRPHTDEADGDNHLRVLVLGSRDRPSVVGGGEGGTAKWGFHLKLPYVTVDGDAACAQRCAFVTALRSREGLAAPSCGWDAAVDAAVLRCGSKCGRALRMLGSRKASNAAVDLGRAYSLLLAVGPSGTEDAAARRRYEADPVLLQRHASIHYFDSKTLE